MLVQWKLKETPRMKVTLNRLQKCTNRLAKGSDSSRTGYLLQGTPSGYSTRK